MLSCSIPCYKDHTANSCAASSSTSTPSRDASPAKPVLDISGVKMSDATDAVVPQARKPALADPPVLRPLTSLRWPYIPEEPSYPDPLAKEEVKPLQLLHYESIATSVKIRRLFASNPKLKEMLRSIDSLQGDQRTWELEKILGVAIGTDGQVVEGGNKEDMQSLRSLAEAIEEVVRGEQGVGLDWDA
ncbi:hypothetical protein FRB96_005686 [Tulasnella sp. 330]|nr:hypothetical protein FRB96_005686 [Tulasnella sp. 330]KAG8883377.1 hypothetical protein FRB98_003149 [Tulasnella sp. 332]